MTDRTRRTLRIAGVAAAAGALVLSGCSAGGDAEGERAIRMPVVSGWAEGVAAAELWKAVLEEEGYDVELEYADIAAVYTGLANGDYDVYLDTWLPVTHASYMEQFGDDLVDLGVWNSEGVNTIAVNADAPIDSLAELADNADLFGNEIIGIEAGSGLSTMVQESVVPAYGLEDMELTLSSTPAMLAALQSATDAGENVVVTLWNPHWAYDAYPVKTLDDPEGALGGNESMHAMGATSFEEDFPEPFQWISDFEMDTETMNSLQSAMFFEYDGDDYGPILEDWIAENREWVDALTS